MISVCDIGFISESCTFKPRISHGNPNSGKMVEFEQNLNCNAE